MIKYILIAVIMYSILNGKLMRNESGFVLDTKTLLIFEDNTEVKKGMWEDAVTYCKDLEYGGFKDWRLPSINELYSIVDLTKTNPAVGDTFKNIQFGYGDQYWTSTIKTNGTDGVALTINFAIGSTQYESVTYDKNANINVMCVRGGLY